MNNHAAAASRFLIEHPQLQKLPELIGDHTGVIATTITVAFEAVAVYGDKLSPDGAQLYQALLRAYLPGRDLTALMAATGYEQLLARNLSEKLNTRFRRVQDACMALYRQHWNQPGNPLGSYVDTVLDLVTLFADSMGGRGEGRQPASWYVQRLGTCGRAGECTFGVASGTDSFGWCCPIP